MKKTERRIEHAYRTACSGIQIKMTDIGKVFACGRQLIADRCSDTELQAGLRNYVETIRAA